MNSESSLAQQNTQLPNTQLRSRSHPCFCRLLRHTSTFWCRHQTAKQPLPRAKLTWTPPPVLTPTPLTCSHSLLQTRLNALITQKLFVAHNGYTLFAHGDVSHLSLQSEQTLGCYCIHTEKKIHLEWHKEYNTVGDMWHKTTWGFHAWQKHRGFNFDLICFVNTSLFLRLSPERENPY